MAETLYWVDADGDTWEIDDRELPIKGRLGPSWTLQEDAYANQHGGSISDTYAGLRTWTFPFSLIGSTDDDLKQQRDLWQWHMNPDRGNGAIRSVRGDGSSRDFVGRYIKGWDDAEESAASGALSNAQMSTTLQVRGGPFWISSEFQTEMFNIDSPRRLWFPMVWPWAPSDSTIWADRLVNNDGNYEAWPRWTIHGPGNGLILTNRTTKQWFSLDYEIGSGEIVTIDMRTVGQKTVMTSGGLDLLGETDGHMWPLRPRVNDIAITLEGADTNSSVQIDWQRLFDGP